MPLTVNVDEARVHFSRYLEQAHAGQEIVLTKAGKPYARLMPLAPTGAKRQAGRLAARLSKAFFESLPVEELDAWEGK